MWEEDLMRASDRAYRTLRTEILDGVLEPGTVLQEVEQSVRLGVSRTPVREALRQLAADGLVEANGRGTIVTAVSSDDIVSLYELREALEAKAAGLAAQRHDDAPFLAIRDRLREAPQLLAQGEEGLADVRVIEALRESMADGRFAETRLAQRDQRPTLAQEVRRPAVRKPKTVNVPAPHS